MPTKIGLQACSGMEKTRHCPSTRPNHHHHHKLVKRVANTAETVWALFSASSATRKGRVHEQRRPWRGAETRVVRRSSALFAVSGGPARWAMWWSDGSASKCPGSLPQGHSCSRGEVAGGWVERGRGGSGRGGRGGGRGERRVCVRGGGGGGRGSVCVTAHSTCPAASLPLLPQHLSPTKWHHWYLAHV